MTYNLISFLEKQKPTDNSIILQEIQSKITSLELWYQRYYTLKMLKEYTSENTVFNTSVSKLYQSILDVEKDEKVLMYLGVK